MGSIYQKAMLNIAVDSAQDTLEGFLKPRNLLTIRSCEHPSLFGPGGPRKVICPSIPNPSNSVEKGILSKRGWILQERALSKRVLHWTSYEVAWECNAFSATERQPDFSQWRGAYWEQIRNAAHGYGNQSGDQAAKDSLGATSMLDPKLRMVKYTQWYYMIEEYTQRALTRGADKLPAISGLAKAFQQSMEPQPEYISGLWVPNLIADLIWTIRPPLQRRVAPLKFQPPLGHHDRLKGLPEYRAPSFSWASVDGAVDFEDSHLNPQLAPELDAQVLDYANQSVFVNASTGSSRSYVRLRGLGILFNQLPPRVKKVATLEASLKVSGRGCAFRVDHDGDAHDWDLLAPKLILLCLRARYDRASEEQVMRWIELSSLAGRNACKDSEISHQHGFRSLYRRAMNSTKSAMGKLAGSSELDPWDVLGTQFSLMLLPTGMEGQFYRVGIYEERRFLPGLSRWKEMTVTVV
ncbi:hypothetical protein GJ744_012246 [Endocarpon pusillum]|uniref:Heterokaryon incompatibility domain-containing protein n=1 Tax=Endocarpon pusillum TaxID=364733 RepID=A0A8H7E293_9EURO|nr:hypothetical protein GJ744_012246 [Endocarpon pusillum]